MGSGDPPGLQNRRSSLRATVCSTRTRFRQLSESSQIQSMTRRPLQEMARRLWRRAFQSIAGSALSISSCVRCHSGRARARSRRPSSVRARMRLRRSEESFWIFTRPRRSSGLSAAVRVVRSMARSDATGPMGGGSGRFRDIRSENCPFVNPNGRSATSKRRARTRAARCA